VGWEPKWCILKKTLLYIFDCEDVLERRRREQGKEIRECEQNLRGHGGSGVEKARDNLTKNIGANHRLRFSQ
jgi:hypothetical protein